MIISEEQHDNALDQVFRLIQTYPGVGTSEGEKLNSLVTLIEQYEVIHYPMKIKK